MSCYQEFSSITILSKIFYPLSGQICVTYKREVKMKIQSIGQEANFQGNLMSQKNLRNAFCSLLLTSSVLTAGIDTFSKSEEPKSEQIEQIVPQKAQSQDPVSFFNKQAGRKEGNWFGYAMYAALFFGGCALLKKFDEKHK